MDVATICTSYEYVEKPPNAIKYSILDSMFLGAITVSMAFIYLCVCMWLNMKINGHRRGCNSSLLWYTHFKPYAIHIYEYSCCWKIILHAVIWENLTCPCYTTNQTINNNNNKIEWFCTKNRQWADATAAVNGEIHWSIRKSTVQMAKSVRL